MRVLITGAAGNLGGILARHLNHHPDILLNLMIHRQDVASDLRQNPDTRIIRADLADPETILPAVTDVEVVVHFAGVLFRHNPEKFLQTTNTIYFKNLLDVALSRKVRRVILISFPHVEGETTRVNPARGVLTGRPESVHARTRLQEEQCLFTQQRIHPFEAVSLRVGMVYGKGILMIEGARWLARHRLLGIWRKPTWTQVISTEDFLNATTHAIMKKDVQGIYHIGDEGYQTLQEFLDVITAYWGYHRPWRFPLPVIFLAAQLCEWISLLTGGKAPLTKDFIRIGAVSYYGDTTRMRSELLPELKYKTFRDGIHTL